MVTTAKIGPAQRLLIAAEQELIANNGHMEMAAIAKRAGVSVGLAYHHYGSKTGLMVAVVDRFYEGLRRVSLGDEIPVDIEWAEREHRRTAAIIDLFYDHPMAVLIVGRLAREPEVLDMENVHIDALLAAGARNIAQGQSLGVVDTKLDPASAVALLMGGLRLAVQQAILAPERPQRGILLERIWTLVTGALALKNCDNDNQKGERHVG